MKELPGVPPPQTTHLILWGLPPPRPQVGKLPPPNSPQELGGGPEFLGPFVVFGWASGRLSYPLPQRYFKIDRTFL